MSYEMGVISDLHGRNPEDAIDIFNEKADYVLINGDLTGYKDKNSFNEIIDYFANDLNPEALVIPGSHEWKGVYNTKMEEIEKEYDHILDMNKRKKEDISSELTVISYGGSKWIPSDIDDPVKINPLQDTDRLAESFYSKRDKEIIFQSHEPAKGYGDLAKFVERKGKRTPLSAFSNPEKLTERGLAEEEHVGDEFLEMLIEGDLNGGKVVPLLSVSGHIHEDGGHGQEIGSKVDIDEKTPVDNLALNGGAYVNGRLSIIDLDENGASYTTIDLDGQK